MRERTIKIGSAGKIFSMTGWKVGFACAAPALSEAFAKAHQFLTFTTPPNLQDAVAFGLAKPREHFDAMREQLGPPARPSRHGACDRRASVILPAAGTYFMAVDLAASGIALSDLQISLSAL